ncbi:MAG: cation transporter [Calditrichaeota bacterium]|nr:MAG: cation transporter [Calditrichota bacterium]
MAASSRKVIFAALTGNSLIAVTKFIAAGITGSSSMLSEGIHSLVDTGNQLLLLLGMKRARRPPDEQFPFGRGKEIYFWSFVVAILIFALGAGISVYEGIHHLQHPREMESPLINYIVLGAAMIFEGAACFFALREFNKVRGNLGFLEAIHRSKDPTMFVVLFEDVAAMAGLVVAFLGVFLTQFTGLLYFDGTASIIIGLILAVAAIWLAYETKGLLIGESADPELVRSIRQMVQEHPAIERIIHLFTLHMGPEFVLVTLTVDFTDSLAAGEVEQIIGELNRRIKEAHPVVKRVFIEAESWQPRAAAQG